MGVVVLLGAVAAGAVIYVLAVLALWLLAGKPNGAEHFILGQVVSRLGLRR